MNKILETIILMLIITLIFSGCIGQSEPESVVISSAKYLDNGEYEKLINLYVNPDTLQPYTSEEKENTVYGLKAILGSNGENIQIQDFKITNKEKVNDTKYMITTYAKYTYTVMGKTETKAENQTVSIVKVNGEWKIADKLPAPGFDTLLGIIGIIGSVYIARKRMYEKHR